MASAAAGAAPRCARRSVALSLLGAHASAPTLVREEGPLPTAFLSLASSLCPRCWRFFCAMSRQTIRLVSRLCRLAHRGGAVASACPSSGGLSAASVAFGALSFPAPISASGRCGASLVRLSAAALGTFNTDLSATLVDDT